MKGDVCRIDGCERIVMGKRDLICCSCHMKKWRHGSYYYQPKPKLTTEEKFWSRVRKTDSCWLWIGNILNNGYGQININKIPFAAHRFSWELHNELIPKGFYILHKCDVRHCVNPEHLFLGTQKDNMDDMINKGRHKTNPSVGEQNGRAKLKEIDVKEIKKLLLKRHSIASIARKFNVSPRSIRSIKDNVNWKHVRV